MYSKLDITDFINRLKDNTKIGDPSIKGTPFAIITIFGKTNKKFYGEFSKSKFRLTENSVFFTTPYIIEGKLKPTRKSLTEVIIKIRPIWFGFLWIRIVPALVLILINFLMINQFNIIETGIYILINIIFVSMFYVPIVITRNIKKRLLKDFYEIFEIIN